MNGSTDTPDFRVLFESAPGLYLVLRNDPPHFTIVAASNAYLAATLTHREQILGKSLFEVFPDNPDDASADGVRSLRDSLTRAGSEGMPDAMAVQKYDIPLPDGNGFEERYWSPLNTPVLDPDGRIRLLIHRVEDVTEFVRLKQQDSEQSRVTSELRARADRMQSEVLARSRQLKESNEQLREANRRLDELDRSKTAFFNNVSHEFRTPLTLILGLVEEALRTRGDLPADGVDAVHRNALRLLQLVNNLLDFARLEAGRLELRAEPVDLATLTADLAGNFRGLLEQGGLQLRVEVTPLPEPVYVDPRQWERILFNLLSNAYKFTLAGEVVVRVGMQGKQVQLQVSDTGVGIPAAELPRMFERFHRIPYHGGRSFEGTGLGLALVWELVTLHGGTIAAESEEGKGSTFSIYLPTGTAHLRPEWLAPAGTAAGQSSRSPYPSIWASTESARPAAAMETHADDDTRPRVVVVDDNADMREFLARVLRQHWRVELHENGLAALEAIRTAPPDLVLSDVMMPGLDGVGLLREMRRNETLATLPVILLSARAGDEERFEGLETGADDYLVKPFSPRELISRVRTHIEMAKTRRQATETATALAETRAALLEDIERKNRELATFSYSVSHDLRAPLRSIDGFSQALLEDYGDRLDPGALDYLNRVRSAARRMGMLIDDLLQLARLERSEMIEVPLDLSHEAREICRELARQDPQRNVSIEIEDGLEASGDRHLVRIALENLLGNAWKFSARTPRPAIAFGREFLDGEPVFYVRDNGAGFDMAYADQLFKPFQRLHTVSEYPGTGIGLATVQRIIERHSGRIRAEGALNAGATFRFTLHGTRGGSPP